MKIISLCNENNNENTLTISTDAAITVKELLERQDVKNFFGKESLSSSDIDTVNNISIELISGADTYLLFPDTEITFTLFGRTSMVQQAVKGTVKVCLGGGLGSKSVLIVSGQSKVSDVLNQAVADAFGTSLGELRNMEVYIASEGKEDEVPGTLDSTLMIGDTVVLEPRKAGKHGCDIELTIKSDTNGVEFTCDVGGGQDLGDAIDEAAHYNLEDDIYTINTINGNHVGAFANQLLRTPVENFAVGGKVTITTSDSIKIHDEEVCDEACERCPRNEEAAAEDTPICATGVAPETGNITVSLGGGISAVTMAILPGTTKLSEVLHSNKIKNVFAMSDEQIDTMRAYVNDQEVASTNITLNSGDAVVLEPRKAGKHGC